MSSADPAVVSPGAQAEDAWFRLKRHLDWCQGFTLGFLFSSRSALVQAFRERLEQIYLTRVSQLQVLQPAAPEEALDAVMALVREPSPLLDDMAAPLWVELHERPGDPAWDTGRNLLLARLNEHRELIRRRLQRPLILVLPQDWPPRREAAEPAATKPVAAAERDDSLLNEWRRLRRRQARDRNALAAGWRAVESLLEQGRTDEACAVAREVVGLAHKQAESDPRTLAVSLDYLGDAALAQVRLEEAGQAYAESLELNRRLRERLGETPQVLRDLSVALNKVGDVAQAQVRLEEAGQAYAESLELRRRLGERLGETPEVLRDLSIALEKVGDVARAQGRPDEAEQAYGEAAVLLRRLDHVFPDREYGPWLKEIEARRRGLS